MMKMKWIILSVRRKNGFQKKKLAAILNLTCLVRSVRLVNASVKRYAGC